MTWFGGPTDNTSYCAIGAFTPFLLFLPTSPFLFNLRRSSRLFAIVLCPAGPRLLSIFRSSPEWCISLITPSNAPYSMPLVDLLFTPTSMLLNVRNPCLDDLTILVVDLSYIPVRWAPGIPCTVLLRTILSRFNFFYSLILSICPPTSFEHGFLLRLEVFSYFSWCVLATAIFRRAPTLESSICPVRCFLLSVAPPSLQADTDTFYSDREPLLPPTDPRCADFAFSPNCSSRLYGALHHLGEHCGPEYFTSLPSPIFLTDLAFPEEATPLSVFLHALNSLSRWRERRRGVALRSLPSRGKP